MVSDDLQRRIASPANSLGAKGRQPRREQVEDAEPRRQDKTYRRYAAGIQGALASFDTTRLEWPDYISFLGRLLKAIQLHPAAVHDLPHKEAIANRLAQCLNPSLPSGVHQKTIEVYSYIFSLIGKDTLAYDLHIYLPGLSPVLTFASLSLRPSYISLLETYIVTLDGEALRPALRALILGLLPGLEEENSEEFDRILRIIDGLRSAIDLASQNHSGRTNVSGGEHFWQCLFLATISSPSRRQGALAYLQRRLPKLGTLSIPQSPPVNSPEPSDVAGEVFEDAEAVISPEPGLLIRCFAAGLSDDQILLQRGYLDLLLSHLPLDSPVLTKRVSKFDLEHLIAAATGVVARRDMSLNRRLWSWFLGPQSNEDATELALAMPTTSPPSTADTNVPRNLLNSSTYFTDFCCDPLVSSLLRMIRQPAHNVLDRARPFRICLSLMDRSEIGNLVIPHVFLPAMESLLTYKSEAKDEDFQEVLRSAGSFFDGVESGVIWARIIELYRTSLDSAPLELEKRTMRLRIANFVLGNFNVREEEMLMVHAPLVASFLVSAINERKSKQQTSLPDMNEDELLEAAIHAADNLIEILPEQAALSIKFARHNLNDKILSADKEKHNLLLEVSKFYTEYHGNLSMSLPPLSAIQTSDHLLMEAMEMLMTGLQHTSPPRSTLVRAKILTVLISKYPNSKDPGLGHLVESFQRALQKFQQKSSLHIPFVTLTAITQVITQSVISRPMPLHGDMLGLPQLVIGLVKHFWHYLSPSYPKYHLETVRSMWQLDDLLPASRTVEASLAKIFVSAQGVNSGVSPKLETAQRFAILWTHTTASSSAPFRRTNSTWSKHVLSPPETVVPSEARQHEERLNRPLLLLLDASQEPDSALGFFLRDWLAHLPNLSNVFGILVRFVQLGMAANTFDMTTSSGENMQTQSMHLDCRAEMLYYLQHILRLLKMPSSHLWNTLSQEADLHISIHATHKNQKQTLIDLITTDCLDIVTRGARLQAISIQEIDVQLQRTALIILQILLQNPDPTRLHKFHIEEVLIDILMHGVDSIAAHPSLQIAMLDSIAAALQVRLAQGAANEPFRNYPGTPILDVPRVFVKSSNISESEVMSPKETSSKARSPSPPPLLIKCLLAGISASSSVHALENWIRFLTEVIPLFGDTLFQNMMPLVDCFCNKIRILFEQTKTVFKNESSDVAAAPEAALLALLSGFEFVLGAGHERWTAEEYKKALNKPPEPTQGFLSNVVSGVFSSESQKARSAVGNTRLTVILCFQDALKLCLATWSWGAYGQDGEMHDITCMASLSYFSQRLRNKSRRILDRMFGAEILECLEALIVVWFQQGALPQKSRNTPIFSLLHVLDGARPKNVMPTIFNSIYSRTNPSAIESSKTSSLTSDITDVEMSQFLIEYTQSLDDDVMDEIWADCIAFLRDVLINPLPHHNILPSLLVFLVTLAEKMENTNFGEQRKMRREMGDLFTRLLSAIFTMRSGGSLQEPAQAMFAGDKVANGDAATGRLARRKSGPGDLLGTLNAVLPRLPLVMPENERLVSVVSNISTNIISPSLHSRNFPETARPSFLTLMLNLTSITGASKIWKKDILDALNNLKFFSNPVSLVKEGWMPLVKKLVEGEKDRIAELCARIPAPTAAGNIFGVGATTARLEADKKTQFNLRRIALLILAADTDFALSNFAVLEDKMAELLNATAASSPSSVTRADIFMVIRAILLKTTFVHLDSLWPMVTAELQRAIASAVPRNKDFDVYNAPSLLQACKLLDLLLVIAPDEFQMHEWLFITDTVEAVYRPGVWDPIALVDELAEDLSSTGDDVPQTPAVETQMLKSNSYRSPLLVSSHHVAEARKEDFVKKVLGPFFSQLSIHAYESTYSMRPPDLTTCENLLLDDLFDDSTIVG